MGMKMSLGTGKLPSCSSELYFHTPSFLYPYALRVEVMSPSDPLTPPAAGWNGITLLGIGNSALCSALEAQEQGRSSQAFFS